MRMRKDCKLQEPYEVAERIYALLVSKNEQRKYVIVNGGKFRFEPSFTSHQRVSQGAVALASPFNVRCGWSCSRFYFVSAGYPRMACERELARMEASCFTNKFARSTLS